MIHCLDDHFNHLGQAQRLAKCVVPRKESLRKFSFILLSVCLLLPQITIGQQVSANDSSVATQEPVQDESANTSGGSENSANQDGEKTNQLELGLSDLIDAGDLGDGWAASFNQVMDKYHLSGSSLGKLIGSASALLLYLLLYYLSKKIIYKIISKAKNSEYFAFVAFNHVNAYVNIINTTLLVMLTCLLVMVLAGIWSTDTLNNFFYLKASTAFQFAATFVLLFLIGVTVFEAVSVLMERFFSRWNGSESTRIRTLLPIARNAVNLALFILLGITLISELGINIMPLLAGAGVLGFAIGFGAQTIIKDLITGFIIIFEDLVQVGDVVTVGGKSGVIEKITIRKIQLRSLDGIVFTVPYSEITVVENMTKDFSYYLFNVGVAYRESPDEVIEILRELGDQMQKDELFGKLILEPIEILGVDQFADSAIIIKARIKTLPIKQWQVGREFNRRMKYCFDDKGIEIPFPHQTIYFGEDKAGDAPAANVKLSKWASVNQTEPAA